MYTLRRPVPLNNVICFFSYSLFFWHEKTLALAHTPEGRNIISTNRIHLLA